MSDELLAEVDRLRAERQTWIDASATIAKTCAEGAKRDADEIARLRSELAAMTKERDALIANVKGLTVEHKRMQAERNEFRERLAARTKELAAIKAAGLALCDAAPIFIDTDDGDTCNDDKMIALVEALRALCEEEEGKK